MDDDSGPSAGGGGDGNSNESESTTFAVDFEIFAILKCIVHRST